MADKSLRNALSIVVALRLRWVQRRIFTRQQRADAEEGANCLRYIIRRHPELLEEPPAPR